MANVKLAFLDPENENELQVYCNQFDEIFIGINKNDIGQFNSAFITLDIETAVKMAKELRRQIAIAKSNIQSTEIKG